MKTIAFTDIDGIEVGNAQDLEAATGCTVILCREGAVGGVDVRGGAPGTRETDLLRPENLVDKVHGILLSGGSAFGLDAASGVMKYLEEKGVGFDVQVAKVPIVCGAVLFDLIIGDPNIRPDFNMGYEACVDATDVKCPSGNIGAGMGATVGKLLGPERAMKGGLGSHGIQVGDLKVAALVAVNCLGDVVDPDTGQILAGLLDEHGRDPIGTEDILLKGHIDGINSFNGNTTIGVIATNASLTKAGANKVASMAHNGCGRTIRPSHTLLDGDTIFTMATGEVKGDVNMVGMLASMVMERAIIDGIESAKSLYGFKSYR
ncbi:MAG: P1 family peptidase [Tissierellia bacterium]|nr:P1 family peptidase [Tissierellia bacterium]